MFLPKSPRMDRTFQSWKQGWAKTSQPGRPTVQRPKGSLRHAKKFLFYFSQASPLTGKHRNMSF